MIKTPPLKSLYYFATVAEQHSIKAAAEKLFVTQAAVSQQIKTLEKTLGLSLFKREHRALTLTAEGKQLLPFLTEGFDTIQHGLQNLKQDSAPNLLTISILPSFASRWLIPRLSRFYSQYPELTINLSMTEKLEDFSDSNVDLAIRFSNGQHDNLVVKPLMKEYIYPVCHPGYLQDCQLDSIDDLKNERLVDDIDTFGFMSWDYWLSQQGQDPAHFKNRQRYDGSHYVLEAALSQQGIAMVRHSLAAEPVKQGNLVRLFSALNNSVLNVTTNETIEVQQQHYLCTPAHHLQRPKVNVFSEWLQAETKAFYEEYSAE